MSRDQRLLLLMHGSGSVMDVLAAWSVLAFSTDARLRYRRLNAVSNVLRASLADPDDVVTLRIEPKRQTIPKKTASWLLLSVLAVVLFFEYRNYTIPALFDVVRQAVHSCGFH